MTLPCWLKHRWGKWHTYEHQFVRVQFPGELIERHYNQAELRQRRQCLNCGRVKDEQVRHATGSDVSAVSEQLQRERVEDSLR